jgi:hypothetical protein
MVNDAVEGEAEVTVAVPWATPSIAKLTVPVGLVAEGLEEVIAAETASEAPAVGVSEAGVTTVLVGLLPVVIVTEADVEPA